MRSRFATIRFSRHPAALAIVTLLFAFLVLLPKGGVKIAGIPVTWGYVIFAVTLPAIAMVRLLVYPFVVRRTTFLVFATLVPFQILFLYSLFVNGILLFGAVPADFFCFFAFPFAFLFVYPSFLDRVDGRQLSAIFRFCVLAAALFGIALFLEYPITGHLFEIPYLTVNAEDAGLIVSTKHIARGPFLKLISTYNNGNLYGAATIIVLPLYNRLESSFWKRSAIKLALFLTLSRAVWFALVAEQMLSFLRLGFSSLSTFPRFALGSTVKRTTFILLTGASVVAALSLFSSDLSFLFATDLGGRQNPLDLFQGATLLPSVPVNFFSEIVYAAALQTYGYLGLASIILLLIVSPVAVLVSDPSAITSPLRSAAAKGLMVYAFISALDGGLNLIPTMAFYWFAYMILLEGWPAARSPVGAKAEPGRSPLLPGPPVGITGAAVI